MSNKIDSLAEISKSLSVKREKRESTDVVVARLKFSGLIVDRETLDVLCGQPLGWSAGALFDELGAPLGRWTISLPALTLVVSGSIRGAQPTERLTLGNAVIEGVEITLDKLCALVAGTLTWDVAGDELEDVDPLLGRECGVSWVVSDGGQQDLLRAA